MITQLWSHKARLFTRLGGWLVCLLALSLLPNRPMSVSAAPQVDPAVWAALQTAAETPIILTLATTPAFNRAAVPTLNRVQDAVIAQTGAELRVTRRYVQLPALAGSVTAAGLSRLQQNPLVASVQPDERGAGQLEESLAALGADSVQQDYGLTGRGVTVAVLDSGIDRTNPDFAGAIVAEHCFLTSGQCLDGGSSSNNAQDQHGHGTNVAGIIASRGKAPNSSVGFAPEASLVAVRVLDAQNTGYFSDWLAGLEWVADHQATYGISLVNMSLGSFTLREGFCDHETSLGLLDTVIKRLQQQGVMVIASTGNQGSDNSVSAPACHSQVVAVGATYNGSFERMPADGSYSWLGANCFDSMTTRQTVACFSNSSEALDLLAPGVPMTSSGLNGGLTTFVGTSQAAPVVTGIAALLRQADPSQTPAALLKRLQDGGTPLSASGRTRPLVHALRSLLLATQIQLIGPSSVVAGRPATFTASALPTASQPMSYTWQRGSDAPFVANGAVTLTWQTSGTYTLTVSLENIAGRFSASRQVRITPAPTATPISTTTPLTKHRVLLPTIRLH